VNLNRLSGVALRHAQPSVVYGWYLVQREQASYALR
jgi:hypothetical protein